jgi:hypothetical protein
MVVSPRILERAARVVILAARWIRRFKPSDVRTAQWFASAIGAAAVVLIAWMSGVPVERIVRLGAPILAVALVAYLLVRYAVPDLALMRFLATRLGRSNRDRHIETLLSASSSKPLDAYLRTAYRAWYVEGLAEAIFAQRRVYRGRLRPPT